MCSGSLGKRLQRAVLIGDELMQEARALASQKSQGGFKEGTGKHGLNAHWLPSQCHIHLAHMGRDKSRAACPSGLLS